MNLSTNRRLLLFAAILAFIYLPVSGREARPVADTIFWNPDLPIEERLDDLIGRLTLEEKVRQMVNDAPAIERLGIPAYNWWNECLHGVARSSYNVTSYPQAIGMAATWDTDAVQKMAAQISDEGRAIYNDSRRKGTPGIYKGLTYWTPNINIFRDPRWGRGQETYGEDPFLTGEIGAAMVRGLQGDDPVYLKASACAKHFAVHSGPEWNRHTFNAEASLHDLWDTYLPAFRKLVTEAGVTGVMGAYNRFEGQACCASDLLLTDILYNQWGYEGYVTSDCGAIDDMYLNHRIYSDAASGSADAVRHGTHCECGGGTYLSLLRAVEDGTITEDEIDMAVRKLFEIRMRLGMFDPDSRVPYSDIPVSVLECEEHREHALEMARKSIVLMKNEGRLLPLDRKKLKKIAVVGPNADEMKVFLANYYGYPSQCMTFLEALREKVGKDVEIIYEKGVNLVDDHVFTSAYDDALFSIDGKKGFRAEYWQNMSREGTPRSVGHEDRVDYKWGDGAEVTDGIYAKHMSTVWKTVFTAPKSETVCFHLSADDWAELLIDGKKPVKEGLIDDNYLLEAEKGRSYEIEIHYVQGTDNAEVKFDFGHLAHADYGKTAASVSDADAIIFAGGLSARVEGEEMSVDIDGFMRGDRTSIELPAVQRNMLKALDATGKPVVMVLMSGSAVGLGWESENIPAIVNAWYGGQGGAEAIADVLFGDYNPAGRLPVTFYRSEDDLPDFEDYSMKNRTYRYFTGTPVYPFGHGLSYTEFGYRDMATEFAGDGSLKVSATVDNMGNMDGDEVVQVYVSDGCSGHPLCALKAFRRVTLKAGASMKVEFTLSPEDLSVVDESGRLVPMDNPVVSIGGGQPRYAKTCTATIPRWENYEFSFRARVPEDADQVQIWASFRNFNRFDRYLVGMKGGLQDDIYLMRAGYMGRDEFMAVRPLGFHPVPGEWHTLRVQVCRNRIRIFVDDAKLPHIDVLDRNGHLAPSGGVTLGEGWIPSEFVDFTSVPLSSDALDGIGRTELSFRMDGNEKEAKRKAERAAYSPVRLDRLKGSRTELSLDGDWLFMPDYCLSDTMSAIDTSSDDASWHIMKVPSFWNPIRICLHGETMPAANGQEHKGVSDTYYQKESERCDNYTFDYRKTGSAWYRQWIELPEETKGRRIVLEFDAVSKAAEVYANGHLAGTNVGMFGSFEVDVTEYMHHGSNLVAVKVIRDLAGSRADDAFGNCYSSVRKDVASNKDDAKAHRPVLTDIPHGFYGDNPAGIWQPVRLVISDPLKIGDVFIKPSLDCAEIDLTICNNAGKKRSFDVHMDIVDKSSGELLYSCTALKGAKLQAGASKLFTVRAEGLKPKLWEPSSPNLYDFTFRITGQRGQQTDSMTVVSGFRTFEARDGFLWLNGRKYWLRGGNHIPFAICPNDARLADRFMQLMQEGNVQATRTHTSPWNELWLDAADRNGIIVSFEGTWSWLMIHSTPIPDKHLLELWRSEWLRVMKRYRNHPSICMWTVNNEMKFYDLDEDMDRAAEKFRIISDVVKDMRSIDPGRPISFDSNYMRRSGVRRFGEDFISTVDDGDIDDNHGYYNWYDFSLFRFFNGEFYRDNGTPDRPLISQEMSTGYPNNETGHPTRSYQIIHQNPFSLAGYESYDWADPSGFLDVQAFITGELAEALRRTGENVSGIMHFSYMTWFRQCYDADAIQPYPAYYAMQRALQPILVSAEIWGRNLYAGDRLQTRIYVVNDSEEARDLGPMKVEWAMEDEDGRVLSGGTEDFPATEYYGRRYIEPYIMMPKDLGKPKTKVFFKLRLSENGNVISENEYALAAAVREWARPALPTSRNMVLVDFNGFGHVLDSLGISYGKSSGFENMDTDALYIVSGMTMCNDTEARAIRSFQAAGGRLLFLASEEAVTEIYPDYVTGVIYTDEGDIAVMERNEHPVFDGIGPLELRYFNNGRREIPLVCNAALQAIRHENLTELASHMKIHAYIDGENITDRVRRIESMRGLTLLRIDEGKGSALISTMCTEKALTDPIACRLLANMLGILQ